MSEQNSYNQFLGNTNNFWLTHPPPLMFIPPQTRQSIYNLDHRIPLIHPHMSSYNNSTQINSTLPYNCNLNYNQYMSYNQNKNNSFPPLPDNIDEEYIIKYLCPIQNSPKDNTDIWIENWLSSKETDIKTKEIKQTNIEINEISNKIKKCKILLENMKNTKQLMDQNILIMTETEWEETCSNLFSIKGQLDMIIQSLSIDDNSMLELKLKLAKRKKKRNRLKRLKLNLKNFKSQRNDEIREINRNIDAWQNIIKENIMKEKRVNKTKVEANIVLKGVKGKIDDAKNQLSLFDKLEKLRKYRLQNCVNKRKNPMLEASLNRLRIIWQQKLKDYNEEEDELKIMLSKSEAKKHEEREIKIHTILSEWDQTLFGPDFKSHEIEYDNNLHTFLDIRKDWDKYTVSEKETSTSSSIPVGWIIPSESCNPDWSKYSNNFNL